MVSGVGALARLGTSALAAAVLLLAGVGPALADGNVSGTWWIKNYRGSIMTANGDPVPFTRAARRQYLDYVAARNDGKIKDDTATYCLPDGVVRASGSPLPFEIRQVGSQVFILYEEDRTMRIVNLGGARTPEDDRLYTFMGESIGRWEGDTLVIETMGFNSRTVLDQSGIPHGEKLRTVERIRTLDGGKTLESLITIEDPEFFTKPWDVRFTYAARPDVQIREYVCGQPHRDVTAVLQGRQTLTPVQTDLPPLAQAVDTVTWKSPNPAMARTWGRGPWRSTKQKPGELGRNDGNGEVPSVMEGWDDRDLMLQPKYLQLMKTYDAAVTAGTPAPTTSSSCDFDGFPAIFGLPNQWQMVHTPDTVYFLYAYNNHVRRVHMNQTHPREVEPSWLGYSTGRWEGDTLVIFTTGMTERGTLNWDGIPRSKHVRTTERYRILPDGRLKLDMLVEDPGVLKKPWNVEVHFAKVEGMPEYNCSEADRDGDAPKE